MSSPVPQPPSLPIIGNVYLVDPQDSIASLGHLSQQYGPIFKLSIFGNIRYFVSSAALIGEVCDEKRFCKAVSGPLEQVRNGVNDGLFTAFHGEHNWEVAHRTLVPAFGPIGIRDMYDEMYDVATQLVSKWARIGPNEAINVTDDYTRLTLDSIALCAMDKRFNSFYTEEMHPFVGAMVRFLIESGIRPQRTKLGTLFNRQVERQYQDDINLMKSVAEEVTAYRRANPSNKKDLLNALLFGKDPKTGERLTDDSIINNMITFLIAGHETTSGLLSFASYFLIKNPETFQRAQQEVDRVVGKGPVRYEHLSKLPYLEAVLRETLRLRPTAPAFAVQPLPGNTAPVILGGEYTLPPDAVITCLLPQAGLDPAVYGDDAPEFKPERMLTESFNKLPPGAWKPFGNGARACIGRPFAWQEAVLALTLILQNFNLRMADPSYQLRTKQTLTIKPDGFFMKASLREGIDSTRLSQKMFAGVEEESKKVAQQIKTATVSGPPMTILYGSNSGTCESLAQSLASSAAARGMSASVKPLDAAVDQFPLDQPVAIISASYEGLPPDNAGLFVEWMNNADEAKFKGAQISVFGCGHKDWVSTYQRVPTLIEEVITKKAGKAIIPRGETNVAAGTIFDDFDTWTDNLWAALLKDESMNQVVEESLDLEISTSTRANHLRYAVQDALVLKNELLTASGVPEKRRIDFKLPSSSTYEAGDYLALLPHNNIPTISRVLRRFGLPWDAVMTVKKGVPSTIPAGKELAISSVLGSYVELSSLATKKNIATLIKYGGDKNKIDNMGSKSVLEILEACPEIELPFGIYLMMLPAMRIRQYSISSSPLNDPTIASITFSVVNAEGHLGVATNYLRHLEPGSKVQLSIKKSHASFHLPQDESTPIIMIAAGTGLAPMYGFIQERAAKIAAGKKLGEAVMFIGCRSPEEDKLYAEQLEKWEAEGAVKLFYAYSRSPERSEDCKYAQDRLLHEQETASTMFNAGAKVFICGSGRLGKGTADIVARIAVDSAKKRGEEITLEQGLKWWEGLRNERYAVDVFD